MTPDPAPMTTRPTRPTVVFYALESTAFPIAGVLEKHAAGLLARTLREQAPIVCLLDHDPTQPIASTQAGLRVTVERDGVRCELTHLPDTAPGPRLAPGAGRP